MDIAKSVGSIGVNDEADVLTVQTLLSNVPIAAGGASSALELDAYEHGPQYTAHNASSYPSFAAHVEERSTQPMGPRYGAGGTAD